MKIIEIQARKKALKLLKDSDYDFVSTVAKLLLERSELVELLKESNLISEELGEALDTEGISKDEILDLQAKVYDLDSKAYVTLNNLL